MTDIERMQTGKRMSHPVVHNGLVYLAGQVGTADSSTEQQTRDVLAKIDDLLKGAGTDKRRAVATNGRNTRVVELDSDLIRESFE